jgi:CoA:oxalate CoA-transferase
VDAVVQQIAAAGVPVAPIWNIEQALTSPQAVARGLLQPVEDARLPDLHLLTQPVKFGGSAPNRATRAPALGEHNEDILSTLLGCGLDKLAELRLAGVFGAAAIPDSTQPQTFTKDQP